MAKDKESVIKSRSLREDLKKKYGTIFTSVWDIDFSRNKMMYDPRPRKPANTKKNLARRGLTELNKELDNAFDMTYRSCRGKEGMNGHSILPYDFMEKVLKFYSEPGDIVLDPTMGDMAAQNTTFHLNRSFIGYDVSEKNFGINKQLRELLLGKSDQMQLGAKTINGKKTFIRIYNQSSEKINEPDNSVDMIFFSPPYWDLEFYGAETEQLGHGNTYEDFLSGLGNVISECFRVLKPGKFCCININDFRKNRKFYDYHIDAINLMSKVGFTRWDTVIIRWQNCIGQCFATRIEETKQTAKLHEYLVVGRKPGGDYKVCVINENEYSEEPKNIKLDGTEKEIEIKCDFTNEEIDIKIREWDNCITKDKAIEILTKEKGEKNGKN